MPQISKPTATPTDAPSVGTSNATAAAEPEAYTTTRAEIVCSKPLATQLLGGNGSTTTTDASIEP